MCKKHKGKKPSVHIHLSTIYHKGGAKPRVKRDWMREKRKELGLTQVQLSAKANVSIRSISHAEMGVRTPRVVRSADEIVDRHIKEVSKSNQDIGSGNDFSILILLVISFADASGLCRLFLGNMVRFSKPFKPFVKKHN